jgi:Membrane-bound serine protease (ClpP class)
MDTTKNKRDVLFFISSIILMIAGGLLLTLTLNVYYLSLHAFAAISLTLLSIFLYVFGATLMGRCLAKKNVHRCANNDVNGGLVFALILVAVGLLLLGFNTGFLPAVWKGFFFSWAILIFIFGCGCLCNRHFIWGIILMVVGKFFLLSNVSNIYPDALVLYEKIISTYWPIGIIFIGLLILLSIFTRSKKFYLHTKVRWRGDNTPNESENHDGKINYYLTFSGTEQVILDPVFKGGNIDITFGGMELDLRRTSLAEGDTYLYVKVVFGGVEITAPDHWDIEIRQNRFAGGIEDSRVKGLEKDKTRKLIIVAKCTFGGIEIK